MKRLAILVLLCIAFVSFISVSAQDRLTRIGIGTSAALSAHSNIGKQTQASLKLVITQVFRGASAWQKIKQATEYSDPAPAGKEYVLVYAKLDYLSGPDDFSIPASTVSFDVLSNNEYAGLLSNFSLPRPPDPVFGTASGTDLKPHQSTEGWIVKEVYENDPGPMLVFWHRLGNSPGVFFALTSGLQEYTETLTTSTLRRN